ncbi:glycosyltransferase [Paenimyroides ceti]
MQHKKILIVSGFTPYPANFGGAIDVWERIKGLHQLGWQVSLLVTDKAAPKAAALSVIEKRVSNFYYVERKNRAIDMIGTLPLQVRSREKLEKVLINDSFDVVLLEGEFCLPIIKNKSIHYKHLVIRVHNNESAYYKALGKSSISIKEKLYYSIEAGRIKKFTDCAFNKADQLWFISQDDLKESAYKKKGVFMPFPINEEMVPACIKETKTILFMGSLFMQNNLYGLDWYLKKVHFHLLKYPDYKLVVVGSTKGNDTELRRKYKDHERLELYFNQTDLKPFYDAAVAFINPMFHGSGVKVKSINALVNGLPLVSTDIGSEGIGLTSDMFWIANDAETFLSQIEELFGNTQRIVRVNKAQEHLKETRYLTILAKQLNEME